MKSEKNIERISGISGKLRILRAKHGLTQAEVAKELGISQQRYSQLEGKNPTVDGDMIKKLCQLYGVSADYLLDIELPLESPKEDLSGYAFSREDIDNIVAKVVAIIDQDKNTGRKK